MPAHPTHSQILLTGATGALGPALAADLARAGAAERIVVLMRASAGELPGRFAQWRLAVQALLGPDEQQHLDCFHPVSGDICQENLGVESSSVGRDTDILIHAAADTNFAAPEDRLWSVNVDGTKRTLDFAAGCPNLRRFLLVSSVFVSGSLTGRIDETATATPPDFTTYYQHTKWQAEQVALASKLPVGIARISMVLGSHANGSVHRVGAIHSLIKWFARGLVPMLPGKLDATGDVIATEMAARCLTRAVMAPWDHPAGTPPIWHIAAAERAPRMIDMVDFVYEHFQNRPKWRRKNIPRPRLVGQAEYDRFIASVDAGGRPAMAQALRSINRFLPDLCYPKTYATARAEALWGGPLPQYDWRETMERVIRFCCPLAA